MKIRELLKSGPLFLDGGMGTLLQAKGLDPGDPPEAFNLINPGAVREVHEAYLRSGSNIIFTNTFGANRLNFAPDRAEEMIRAAIGIAKGAANEFSNESDRRYVALDIGPSGRLMEPFGDLSFEDAVSVFSEMVKAGVKYGADLIAIETMSDLCETKAALLAAKEDSDLPVIVSNSYQANGRLMTGADPLAMIAMLEGLGADAIGMNCSLGPAQLEPVVKIYLENASVPVLVKPNAGMPRMEGNKVVYDITAGTFAGITAGFAASGAAILGGCCGTTPEYIRLLVAGVSETPKAPFTEKPRRKLISSHSHAIALEDIDLSDVPRLEGKTIDDLVDSACDLEDEAPVLFLDTGETDEGERSFLEEAVSEIQSSVKNPLMIRARDPEALKAALRVYRGNPAVRPFDDSEENCEAAEAAVGLYGGIIV